MLSSSSGTCMATSSCKARPALLRAQHSLVQPPCVSRLQARLQPQRASVVPQASSSGDKSSPTATTTSSSSSSSAAVDEEEARIEAIEAASRKARSKTAARRQIPIRNVTPRQTEVDSNRAEWKKGKLFPEGWEQMDLAEKVTELYLGKRGMLFWASEVAWKGAIALGVAWTLFRIGGAVGLYQLQGDLIPPPL